MSDDSAIAVEHDDDPPSAPEPVVEMEPLRTDADGQPVYAEWDDSWAVEPEPSNALALSQETAVDVREQVQQRWDNFREYAVEHNFDRTSLLSGVEKVYSTSEAADFFGKSNQWMYWGLRTGVFTYKNGDPILPERVGKMGKRRFTLPVIREIALSCHRRGNLTEEQLEEVMERILIAQFGRQAFASIK